MFELHKEVTVAVLQAIPLTFFFFFFASFQKSGPDPAKLNYKPVGRDICKWYYNQWSWLDPKFN